VGKYKNQYVFAPDKRRREGGHRVRGVLLVFVPIVILLLVVTNFVVSNHVVLANVKQTILNLPEDLEQYSILHLSDLHGAELGDRQQAISAALGTTRYSCVIMTGDMLGENNDVEPLLDIINLMPADTPKYYIIGDTDGSFLDDTAHGNLSVYADWAQTLINAGVTIVDRPLSETRGDGTIWFVPEEVYTLDLDGMESMYRERLDEMDRRATALTADDAAKRRVLEYQLQRMQEIRTAKETVQPEDIQVVLTHTPLTEDYVQEMASYGTKEDYFSMRYAGIILAGHYNGGQWRLPLGGAIYVPELGWFPDDELVVGMSYPAGIPQYISPGLGSDPHYEYQPGRIYNAPTVTLITLTRKAVSQ